MRRDERGASAIEYVGGVVVAALLVTGVHQAVTSANVQQVAGHAVCTVTGGDCAAPGQDFGGDGDRRDQQRGARDDRRGRGSDGTPPGTGLPGSGTPASPLGPPVPGTSVPEPAPPAWSPPDEGAGPYDSEDPSLKDRATEVAAETGANALAGTWPAASRNLLHFLGNTGEPLKQDVNAILDDVPRFSQQIDGNSSLLGQQAVQSAKQSGATGPVTFPINTPWQGFYIGPDDSANWFYALGGISYNQTGSVTVYPPATPGGEWTYEVSTRVNLRDQYNWDGSKSTPIGPLKVTDKQLAELHRAGLAREFAAYGRSDLVTTKGTAP
jgi:hypothetical protein